AAEQVTSDSVQVGNLTYREACLIGGGGGGGGGGDQRAKLGMKTKGPTLLITDLAVWTPDDTSKEFIVRSLHPGVTRDQVQETCGWTVRFDENVVETPPPSTLELTTLRDLNSRTAKAHAAADADAAAAAAS
ncbi:MAG: hypothetical protein ABJ358_06285, partial [Rhizobiaceae bacterium]